MRRRSRPDSYRYLPPQSPEVSQPYGLVSDRERIEVCVWACELPWKPWQGQSRWVHSLLERRGEALLATRRSHLQAVRHEGMDQPAADRADHVHHQQVAALLLDVAALASLPFLPRVELVYVPPLSSGQTMHGTWMTFEPSKRVKWSGSALGLKDWQCWRLCQRLFAEGWIFHDGTISARCCRPTLWF